MRPSSTITVAGRVPSGSVTRVLFRPNRTVSELLLREALEAREMSCPILQKERTRDARDEPRNRVLHPGDAGAAEAEAQKTAERVVVELSELRQGSRLALGELEVRPEIRVPQEVLVAFRGGRLKA